MRHRKKGRKLGRNSSSRLALSRNQFLSLLLHGEIRTTLPKAKELRSFAERLITLAREDSVARRRLVTSRLGTANKTLIVPMVAKLFNEIAPRYKGRPGGYCRVLKCGFRPGDKAPMAIIQLVAANDSSHGDNEFVAQDHDNTDQPETVVSTPSEPESVAFEPVAEPVAEDAADQQSATAEADADKPADNGEATGTDTDKKEA